MKSLWLCIVCGLLAVSTVRAAEPAANPLEGELKNVLAENLRASEAEDIAAVQKTIHTKSPSYASTPALGEKVFAKFDLKYDMLSFEYVGMNGDYAVARAKQRTESKDPDATFKANEVDCMYVFRQEDGAWKLWTQAVLAVDYVH